MHEAQLDLQIVPNKPTWTSKEAPNTIPNSSALDSLMWDLHQW